MAVNKEYTSLQYKSEVKNRPAGQHFFNNYRIILNPLMSIHLIFITLHIFPVRSSAFLHPFLCPATLSTSSYLPISINGSVTTTGIHSHLVWNSSGGAIPMPSSSASSARSPKDMSAEMSPGCSRLRCPHSRASIPISTNTYPRWDRRRWSLPSAATSRRSSIMSSGCSTHRMW